MRVAQRARTSRWLAWSVAVLVLAATASVWVLTASNEVAAPDLSALGPDALVGPAVIALVAAVLASRLPRNPVGWLLLIVAVAAGAVGLARQEVRHLALAGVTSGPALVGAMWVESWAILTVYPGGALPLLFLLFPHGGFPSRRWRFVGWAALAEGVIEVALGMVDPSLTDPALPNLVVRNPIGVEALGPVVNGPMGVALWLATAAVFVAAAASLVARWRRASGVERHQLAWVAYAVAATALLMLGLTLVGAAVPELVAPWLYDWVAALGFGAALPAAVGVAVLRHRLYDIDAIVRRTLLYGVLTVLLAAFYVGSVVLLQQVLRALTGERSDVAVVVATLASAALFAPLRSRVQRVLDRLFYRSQQAAEEVLREVGRAVRVEVDGERLSRAVLGAVDGAMRPEHVSLWVRAERGRGA